MAGLKAVDGKYGWPGVQTSPARCALKAGTVARLLTILLLCTGVSASRAEDGNALLRKMADAYQHLSTYEFHSNVDFLVSANGRTMQSQSSSNVMQCKRPNKMVLVVYNTGPTGTRSIYSDGTTLTIYDAVPNHYYSGPTASTFESIMRLLATRARITANLDPLYFLCTNKLPATLRDIKAGNNTIINGRPSFVVMGTISSGQGAVQKGNAVTTSVMHWTWYIDQQNYLLNKVEAHSDPIVTTLKPRVKGKGTPTKVSLVMNLRHTISATKVNLPLDDGVFVFHPPAGATGQNVEPVKGAR
jgi:outer membrane lipoprotein-sorting protein